MTAFLSMCAIKDAHNQHDWSGEGSIPLSYYCPGVPHPSATRPELLAAWEMGWNAHEKFVAANPGGEGRG